MRRLLYIILLIFSFCACKRQVSEPDLPSDQEQETAIVSFSIDCMSMDEVVTKGLPEAGENVVKDLNVYLFNERSGLSKHLYLTSQTSQFSINLFKGDYDLFVIANYGKDLDSDSTQTLKTLKTLPITIKKESDIDASGCLLMSSYKRVTITGPMDIPIELKRKVAKVKFNLSIAPAFAPNFTLTAIEVRNAPAVVKLFEPSAATAVLDYKYSTTPPSLTQFYLLENAQGENPLITDQKYRNHKNAPKNATYIYVKGEIVGKVIEYCIYLGANNTTDFNVFGNNQYEINTVISGINDIDTRVSVIELTSNPFLSQYNPGETAHGSIILNASNNLNNSYTLKYRIFNGTGKLTIGGIEYPEDTEFQFLNAGESSRSALLAYTEPNTFAVKILFTAKDQSGTILTKELKTRFGTPSVTEIHLKYDNQFDGTINIWAESSQPISVENITIHYTAEVQYIYSGTGPFTKEEMSSGSRGVLPLIFTRGTTKSRISTLNYKGSTPNVMGVQFYKWKTAQLSVYADDYTTYKLVY